MAIIETTIIITFGVVTAVILAIEAVMLLGFYAEWKNNKGQKRK